MGPRNTYEYEAVGVAGVPKVDGMRVKKALHCLAKRDAMLLGVARGFVRVPFKFPGPNRAHLLASPDGSFSRLVYDFQASRRRHVHAASRRFEFGLIGIGASKIYLDGPSHTIGRAGPHPAVRKVEVTLQASADPVRRSGSRVVQC